MLRPKHVIAWFIKRSEMGRTDISQLLDGLLIGGQIVVGGAEANVLRVRNLMGSAGRTGRVVSLAHAQLDLDTTTTFDAAAVCQLLMVAQNESFHSTAEALLGQLEELLADGHAVGLAIETVRQRAAAIQKL